MNTTIIKKKKDRERSEEEWITMINEARDKGACDDLSSIANTLLQVVILLHNEQQVYKNKEEDKTYLMKEAAELVGVHPNSIRKWLDIKVAPCGYAGKYRVVPESSIQILKDYNEERIRMRA